MNKKKDKGNGQMGRSMTERKVDPFCMGAYENGYQSNSSCQINFLSLPQF